MSRAKNPDLLYFVAKQRGLTDDQGLNFRLLVEKERRSCSFLKLASANQVENSRKRQLQCINVFTTERITSPVAKVRERREERRTDEHTVPHSPVALTDRAAATSIL